MVLAVEQARPEMVLTRDVVDLNYAVLLSEGTSLTAQHLRTLKMWGVESIHVAGDAEGPPPVPAFECPPPELKAAEDWVDRRLKFVPPGTPGFARMRARAVGRAVASRAGGAARSEGRK